MNMKNNISLFLFSSFKFDSSSKILGLRNNHFIKKRGSLSKILIHSHFAIAIAYAIAIAILYCYCLLSSFRYVTTYFICVGGTVVRDTRLSTSCGDNSSSTHDNFVHIALIDKIYSGSLLADTSQTIHSVE